jgi:hypothetical protein
VMPRDQSYQTIKFLLGHDFWHVIYSMAYVATVLRHFKWRDSGAQEMSHYFICRDTREASSVSASPPAPRRRKLLSGAWSTASVR